MIPDMTSVILPTTGRPERAELCVRQLLSTIPTAAPFEVVCVVGADEETYKKLQHIQEEDGRVVLLWEGELQGCSKAWNKGLICSSGQNIVIGADDLWFSPGWHEAALASLTTLPDSVGLVGLNDGHGNADTPCTHWLASRQFLIQYMGGVMAWEHYKFCCNDTEAYYRAINADRYIWCEQALVRHDHPAHGTRPHDENDARNSKWASEDLLLFYARKEQGFPDDFPPAIYR